MAQKSVGPRLWATGSRVLAPHLAFSELGFFFHCFIYLYPKCCPLPEPDILILGTHKVLEARHYSLANRACDSYMETKSLK